MVYKKKRIYISFYLFSLKKFSLYYPFSLDLQEVKGKLGLSTIRFTNGCFQVPTIKPCALVPTCACI